MPIDPIDLFKKAVKKVTAMKYTFGVIALAATIAIFKILNINDTKIPVFNLSVVFIFTILIYIFSKEVSSKSLKNKREGKVLNWLALLIFTGSALCIWSSFFFDVPKPFDQLWNFGEKDTPGIPNEYTTRIADFGRTDKVPPKPESQIQDSQTEGKLDTTIHRKNTTSDSKNIHPKNKSFETGLADPYKNKCFRINLLAGGCIAFRKRPLNEEETKLVNVECVTTNDCQVRSYPNLNKKSCLRKKLLDETTIIRFISNNEQVTLLGDINESYLKIKDINGVEGYISSQFYDAVTIKECNDNRTSQNIKYESR